MTFPLSVRPANNFPIDLYLLMDLSFSMRDDLDNLKQLGAELGKQTVMQYILHSVIFMPFTSHQQLEELLVFRLIFNLVLALLLTSAWHHT